MKTLDRCLRLLPLVALVLVPALAQAHPGHGLGPIGHDLQHAAWNFFGMAILAALMLTGDRLFAASLQLIMKIIRKPKD